VRLVCVCAAGIDSRVHFESSSQAASSRRRRGDSVTVDDVYQGTKAALSAGNTTLG